MSYSWCLAEQWINMFSSQCSCSSLICIVLLFKLFWTASNDICELHMRWINWLVSKSVLLDSLEVLYLKFRMRLMLCRLLLVELSVSSHLVIRLNRTTLSMIYTILKCYWCLLETIMKRTSFIASLFFLWMNLLCDRNYHSLMMKTAKVSWVTDFRFWLILRSIKSISICCLAHASVI